MQKKSALTKLDLEMINSKLDELFHGHIPPDLDRKFMIESGERFFNDVLNGKVMPRDEQEATANFIMSYFGAFVVGFELGKKVRTQQNN